MLNWSISFLILALIAGVLGFGGIAGTSIWIAKLLFFGFLAVFLFTLLFGRKTVVVSD